MKLKPSKAILRDRGDGIERRVHERTTELTAANEELKTQIAERKRTEALLDGQRQVLEMIAAGGPLTESLAALVRFIEEQAPGMLGSILLIDELKRHFSRGVAPSLPPGYVKAIYGLPIGPAAGSCGTAAYRKESVVVNDIATDPLWKDYRDFALPHGLRACWSTPILSAQRELLGTFAMYYRQPALPEPEHWWLVEAATHIASIAISRDRAESALRENQAKLEEAQRIGNIGYWERDLINDRITFSEEARHIIGLPQQSVLSQETLQKMIYPDDRPIQKQALEDALKKGRPYNVEYRIIRPSGETRFVRVRDETVYDRSGRLIRMFGTVQDITESKQAEELVKAREQEIRAIVEHSPDPIIRFDRNMRCSYVNPAFTRLNGGSQDALLGQTARAAVKAGLVSAAEDEAENMERALKAVVETNLPVDFETTWSLPDAPRSFTVHLEPEFDAHGNLASILSVGRDITERKRAQEKLHQAELELARVARVTIMGELCASIAHEVNQPLAGVVTNANAALRWLAMSPPNLDEAGQAVRRIAADGSRASEVIQRVRALIKKREPARKPTSLNKLIQDTILLIQPELKRKCVSLKMELAPDLPLVPADFVQGQQVLLNLIVNAIDSLGAVTERPRTLCIRTNRVGLELVQLVVEDNGVGINPAEASRLFEPFYTTKSGGLGMGLAISRSIVEAHGGRLWATSRQGHGATFHLTLPVNDPDEP